MKRLLEFALAVGVVGCGTHHRGEDSATPRTVESRQRTDSEAPQKDTPVPARSPQTASTSVPSTASAETIPGETVASEASPISAVSEVPVEQRSMLEMTVAAPAAAVTLREVNQGEFGLQVQLKNSGAKTVTLWPYLSVEIVDSRGKAVPRSMNLGRFGFRSTPSILEGIPFVSLDPGGIHEIEINLKRYRFDSKVITGWRFARPGRYAITLVYAYDRALAVMDYGEGCQNLNRPDAPWNLAIETRQTRQMTLQITK